MPLTSPDLLADAVRDRFELVRERIDKTCARAGRASEEVTLIAVTKTFPPQMVEAGIAAGLTDFGENRVQELVAKSSGIPGQALGGTVRWHLIGSLQRNKAKEAARRADFFHALDTTRLGEVLNRRAKTEERVIPCMVQVNVSGEATKSGVNPDDLRPLLEDLASFENLAIRGLMTLASPALDESELERVVRPQFAQMRALAEASRAALPGIQLDFLSMGMSGDFEIAIEEGATHIRLGSALFGPRPQ